jgi:predicted TIM-barrel enzyme
VIAPRTTREEILAKLNAKRDANIPIYIASAGSGLVAQLLEKAGADCVNTFSGARLRANGMGTMAMLWPILDSNQQTLDYTAQDIMPAIKGDAFICACLNANDPLKDMRVVLEQCRQMGVESVSNIGPSISYVDKDSQIFRVLNKCGVTLQNEIDMLSLGREMNMVTVGLAFDMEDSLAMVEQSQPDIFCFHAGTTKGGLTGYDSGETIDETARRTEEVVDQLRAIKPDIFLVAHGAAMETPEEAQHLLNNTSCDGIWTGSSTERLPIERAVYKAAKQFADLRFPTK